MRLRTFVAALYGLDWRASRESLRGQFAEYLFRRPTCSFAYLRTLQSFLLYQHLLRNEKDYLGRRILT